MKDGIAQAVDHARMMVRLVRDVPGFLRTPVTLEEAQATIRRNLDRRQERLLRNVSALIFTQPRSPYLRLFRHAGCELGDVKALVRAEGVDGGLRILAQRGVYVTFDEMKGRLPIVRGSLRLDVADTDFDNPACPHHFPGVTGGSSGRPAWVKRSLASVHDGARTVRLWLHANGIDQASHIMWWSIPIPLYLKFAKVGQPTEAWFYPVEPLALPIRAVCSILKATAALAGHGMPTPRHLGLQETDRIVDLVAGRTGETIVVNSTVSSAVRVALTATARRVRLEHVVFLGRGEPMTAARRRLIETTGARVIQNYAANELPYIGYSCPNAEAPDDVHLCTDRYAVVEQERTIGPHGLSVSALLLTSLDPATPKVAFNTELGDSARIEHRDGTCCALGRIGLTTHISEIRSFEKLTGEGTTFARTNIAEIVEEILPARFGGAAVHYQLVEEEDSTARTRLVLRIDPDLGPLDEASVLAVFHAALERDGAVARNQSALWKQAGTVTVRRDRPLSTPAGKVLPFHLARYDRQATR